MLATDRSGFPIHVMRQDDSDGEMGDLIPGLSGKHFTAWLGLRRGTKSACGALLPEASTRMNLDREHSISQLDVR
jgi:hypothetical protein